MDSPEETVARMTEAQKRALGALEQNIHRNRGGIAQITEDRMTGYSHRANWLGNGRIFGSLCSKIMNNIILRGPVACGDTVWCSLTAHGQQVRALLEKKP